MGTKTLLGHDLAAGQENRTLYSCVGSCEKHSLSGESSAKGLASSGSDFLSDNLIANGKEEPQAASPKFFSRQLKP